MKINFKMEKDDLLNFNEHIISMTNKKNSVKIFVGIIYLIILSITLGPKLVHYGIDSIDNFDIFFVLLMIFIIIGNHYGIFGRKLMNYFSKRTIDKGDFSSVFGEYSLEIIHDDIFVKGNESETKFKLNKIINYFESEKYFFLYLTSCSAYVINKNSVVGDREQMFTFFRENIKKSSK